MGPYVRRHRPLRQRKQRRVSAALRPLFQNRARDRFQVETAYHFRRPGRRRCPAERRLDGDRIRDHRLPLPGLAIQARGFRCRVRFAPGSGSRATSTGGIRTALDVGEWAGEFQASNFERRRSSSRKARERTLCAARPFVWQNWREQSLDGPAPSLCLPGNSSAPAHSRLVIRSRGGRPGR